MSRGIDLQQWFSTQKALFFSFSFFLSHTKFQLGLASIDPHFWGRFGGGGESTHPTSIDITFIMQ